MGITHWSEEYSFPVKNTHFPYFLLMEKNLIPDKNINILLSDLSQAASTPSSACEVVMLDSGMTLFYRAQYTNFTIIDQ